MINAAQERQSEGEAINHRSRWDAAGNTSSSSHRELLSPQILPLVQRKTRCLFFTSASMLFFALDPSWWKWKRNHFLRKWYFNLVPHNHNWLLSCIQWRLFACCLLVVTHLLLNSWCSPGGKGRGTGNNFMWSIELKSFSLETGFFCDPYDYFCLFSCGFQARYRLNFHLNY